MKCRAARVTREPCRSNHPGCPAARLTQGALPLESPSPREPCRSSHPGSGYSRPPRPAPLGSTTTSLARPRRCTACPAGAPSSRWHAPPSTGKRSRSYPAAGAGRALRGVCCLLLPPCAFLHGPAHGTRESTAGRPLLRPPAPRAPSLLLSPLGAWTSTKILVAHVVGGLAPPARPSVTLLPDLSPSADARSQSLPSVASLHRAAATEAACKGRRSTGPVQTLPSW